MSKRGVEASLAKIKKDIEELDRHLNNIVINGAARDQLLTKRREKLRAQAILYQELNRD